MKKSVLFLTIVVVLSLFKNALAETIPAPGFSHGEGFYAEPFELQIACPESYPHAWVTFDGSYPGPENAESVLFTDPLFIDSREGEPDVFSIIPLNNGDSGLPAWLSPTPGVMKASIVGAVCVNDDNDRSEQTFKTYFVGLDSLLSFNVPIISIIAPPDSLFGHERGIMVPGVHYVEGQNRTGNFVQRGNDWERMIHISFFEPDGQLGFGHFAGVRIHGNFTRSFPQKGLRLYSRASYGKSRFDYKLFEHQPQQRFNRFVLKASGNDWGRSMFRDAVGHQFISSLPIETIDYRPSVVFINGEFWGLHNIRERYDVHYLDRYYSLSEEEEIDYIDFSFRRRPHINEGDDEHYMYMLEYAIANDLSLPENYAYIQTLMDIDNYLLMLATGVYSSNTDWPQTNVRAWRTRNDFQEEAGVKDGRWRWLINDLDFGFGLFQQPTHNNLARIFEDDKWYNELFLALMENEHFKSEFISLLANFMHTYMHPNHTNPIINEAALRIESIMPMHIDRWKYPASTGAWNNTVNSFRNWMINRPQHMREQIVNQFELDGIAPFTIDVNEPNAGMVKINSIFISPQTAGIPQNPYPFEATYFAGIPVRLEAIANAGYRFNSWIGFEGNDSVILVDPAMLHEITAVFEFEPFDGDEMNPAAHDLSVEDYVFDFWGPEQPQFTFPENMKFHQTATTDPGLEDEMTSIYYVPENEYHDDDASALGFPYALTRRTRINALAENGISFINTGRGRDVGAAVLALDLRSIENAYVNFTAGTVTPNERVYAIRLQYRVGNQGMFNDLTMDSGEPVEYLRNEVGGHEVRFSDIRLPEEVMGHPYVQLRWKYYHVEGSSGPRAELRLDDIAIKTEALISSAENIQAAMLPLFKLHQNYPNPFHANTNFSFDLAERSDVVIEVFNMSGQRFITITNGSYDAGSHVVNFNAEVLSPGFYIYRIHVITGNATAVQSKRMMVLPY